MDGILLKWNKNMNNDKVNKLSIFSVINFDHKPTSS